MESTIPKIRVCANPLMEPLPKINRTSAAIRVVMLPSKIAERALSKPIFSEDFTVFPVASSSRIRAKMITLASTAIPMERMIPAIPGNVRVISNPFNNRTIRAVYSNNAKDATKPGRK